MGILKRKKRDGAQLWAFFAANDPQLSSWLNRQNVGERGVVIATVDAALAAPNRGLFEQTLLGLYGQYMEAEEGSDHEARMNAITRILGYEYEQSYKGSMQALVGHFFSLIDDDSAAEQDVFCIAATGLVGATRENSEVLEQDQKLSSACHFAAAAVLMRLGESSGDESDWTEEELARIISTNDLKAAARAVFAVSWYFALYFVRPMMNDFDEDTCDGWLASMYEALGSVDEACVAEPAQVRELYDNYKAIKDAGNKNFPIQFGRWLNMNLGSPGETSLVSSVALARACQAMRDPFKQDLVQQGLL